MPDEPNEIFHQLSCGLDVNIQTDGTERSSHVYLWKNNFQISKFILLDTA